MAVKKGLGKGLDSLIPSAGAAKKTAAPVKKESTTVNEKVSQTAPAAEKNAEILVSINKVEPNRSQPRTNFDEDALAELADSIKKFGVLQPLLVQEKDNYYEIIAGERRWRAAKLAGLKKIPVIIRDYTEKERVEIALIENIQRENLNPIEEALAYKRLLKEFNLKQEEVADRVSKSRTTITNAMRLLKLDERVQQMVIDDAISTGHARALLAIEEPEKQYELANQIFDENLSVRETEKLIRNLKKPAPEKPEKPAKNIFYQDMEEKMRSAIGTKVTVKTKAKGKGKIEIEYYNADDLERIYSILMNSANK